MSQKGLNKKKVLKYGNYLEKKKAVLGDAYWDAPLTVQCYSLSNSSEYRFQLISVIFSQIFCSVLVSPPQHLCSACGESWAALAGSWQEPLWPSRPGRRELDRHSIHCITPSAQQVCPQWGCGIHFSGVNTFEGTFPSSLPSLKLGCPFLETDILWSTLSQWQANSKNISS